MIARSLPCRRDHAQREEAQEFRRYFAVPQRTESGTYLRTSLLAQEIALLTPQLLRSLRRPPKFTTLSSYMEEWDWAKPT